MLRSIDKFSGVGQILQSVPQLQDINANGACHSDYPAIFGESDQSEWALRTRDTIYISFKTPAVLFEVKKASVNLKKGCSLRLWVPPQCLSVMGAFKNYDAKFRKWVKETQDYKVQTRMVLDHDNMSIKYVYRKIATNETSKTETWEDMFPEKTGFMTHYVIPAPDYKKIDYEGIQGRAYRIPKHSTPPPIVVGGEDKPALNDEEKEKLENSQKALIHYPLGELSSKEKTNIVEIETSSSSEAGSREGSVVRSKRYHVVAQNKSRKFLVPYSESESERNSKRSASEVESEEDETDSENSEYVTMDNSEDEGEEKIDGDEAAAFQKVPKTKAKQEALLRALKKVMKSPKRMEKLVSSLKKDNGKGNTRAKRVRRQSKSSPQLPKGPDGAGGSSQPQK